MGAGCLRPCPVLSLLAVAPARWVLVVLSPGLLVRCPLPHPPALAVHTGSVPLATIVRVFILVPGHRGGGGVVSKK